MSDQPWMGLLEKALWGIDQAADRLRDDETRAKFETACDWWRKPGRSGALRGVQVPEETAVSAALKILFDRIQAEQIISGTLPDQEDLRQFHFSTEARRVRDPALSRNAKPTDIAIVLRASEIFDFRIEAKILISEGEIIPEYLSESGLLRFEDTNNPYTVEPYGGMLAYVVNDATALWEEKVKAGLLTKLGPARIAQTQVGPRYLTTSKHRISIVDQDTVHTLDLSVFHLVHEIEARPSLRKLART